VTMQFPKPEDASVAVSMSRPSFFTPMNAGFAAHALKNARCPAPSGWNIR
jgi:hypothetical protein